MGTNVVIGSFERFFKHRRTNTYGYGRNNATIELLKSSILVAFSGAIRIHLAFLLLQVPSSIPICVAGGLIIYTIYTLDRTLGSEEDAVNRTELNGSRKEIGLAVCLLTFLTGSYILAKEDLLIIAFIPFVICYLYSKGIKIGESAFKLKGGFGVKNLVVGLTWGLFIAGLAGSNCGRILPVVLVFIFFGVKLFVNSTIFDFKDIKGDTLAGIKTLPVSFGEQNTKKLLTGMYLLSHIILGIALVSGIIAFEPLIILYSLICGLTSIQNHAKSEEETPTQKLERKLLVHGESVSILALRQIAGSLLA